MLVHPAEQSFQKGLEELSRGHYREAQAFFGGAIEIEKRLNGESPQARYMSYYGLTLSLNGGDQHEAVRCCRAASKLEGYRPEVCLNLGRVLLKAGRMREAHQALLWGFRMQPSHSDIQRELKRMGVRRRPVLSFLARDNALNVFLGRMTPRRP